jgi:hypothetical protein
MVEDSARKLAVGEKTFDPMGLDGYDTGASNKLSCKPSSTQNLIAIECTCI